VNLAAIDLNLLVALDALLSEASVTRAAARIGRSQPATTHALNRARALLGDPLLVRMGGSLRPTQRARMLAPRIRRLLEEVAAVLETGSGFRPSDIDSIAIGATDYVGFVLVPGILRASRRDAPRMALRLRALGGGRDPLAPLVDGAIDLAIGTFPHVPAGLRAEEILRDEFVCLVRKGHPVARRRPSLARFAELDHVLVTSPSEDLGPVDHALARRGRGRRIAAYVPHFLVAPQIVAETDLVLTTGRRIAERIARPLGLRSFAPPLPLAPFSVRMIWHPRSEDEAIARWFRDIVRTAARLVARRRPRL
jgi:DNA-binding transcriptional LysR family regulator